MSTAGTAIILPPPPTPEAPEVARASGRVTVFGSRGGRAVPLAFVSVRAYVPGTDTPWPDPLYDDEAAATPVAFPLVTGPDGVVALWADAPARVELRCQAPGYVPERRLVDLVGPPTAGQPGGALTVPPAAPLPLPPPTGEIEPRAPGYARAFGRVTIFGTRGDVAVPLSGAAVWAYVPGTSTPWANPLYPAEDSTTPVTFPLATGADGEVRLWSDAEGRLELAVQLPGYTSERAVLDLELPPGTPLPGSDPYPQYQTKAENDALYQPLGSYLTQALADARYPLKTDPDPYPVYLTQPEGDARYQPSAQKGQAGGYAPLDAGGLLPNAYLPPLAITNTYVAASQAAMLALTAQTGDVCVRTDLNKTYILAQEPASTLANWQEVLAPTGGGGGVTSVDGQTGVVDLTSTYVNATGGDTMAGPLTVSSGGIAVTGASTFSAAPTVGGSPLVTQTAGDARYLQSATAATTYVAKAGDALTGALTMNVGGTAAAASGDLRLRSARAVAWRNAGNTADLALTTDASDRLTFGGLVVVTQAALDALTTRVTTLETQMAAHKHTSGTIDQMGGTAVMS